MFSQSNCVELKNCLACGSSDLKMTLDLNMQSLANSYRKEQSEWLEMFPLAINRCEKCYHVQLTHAVDPDLMFKDYLYVTGTSKTMNDHCKWFADYTTEYFLSMNTRKAFDVFDIGCNDGTQLNFFKEKNIGTYGVDPAENLHPTSSKSHKVWLDYFSKDFISKIDKNNFDILVAQNVFAHNFDPLSFLKAASEIMSTQSLFFVQTSQADMILNNEFDTIYHEHISFYNINSMRELCKRAGLFIVDVTKCPLHGNSYIFVLSKVNRRPSNVDNLIDMERRAGLLTDSTYVLYAERCYRVIEDLKRAVRRLKSEGYHIVGYGAAAKGMTLLNFAEFSFKEFDCIIDDNPLKQDRYTPGSSILIVSSSIIDHYSESDKIVFVPLAWNFFDEIKSKIQNKRNNPNDLFIRFFPSVKVT